MVPNSLSQSSELQYNPHLYQIISTKDCCIPRNVYGHLDVILCFEMCHQRLKMQDDRPVIRGVDQSTDRDTLININKDRTVRSHNTFLSTSRVTSGRSR